MMWDVMQGSICGGKSRAECMCTDTGDPFWCDKAAQERMSRGSSWPPAPSPGDGAPEKCTGGACGPAGATSNESTSLTPQQQAIKRAEQAAYHKICDTPPQQGNDRCENARAKVKWHNRCLDAREAFTNKWYGGKFDHGHAEQMRQKRSALSNAKIEEMIECAGRH